LELSFMKPTPVSPCAPLFESWNLWAKIGGEEAGYQAEKKSFWCFLLFWQCEGLGAFVRLL
jgi:hypothetical protein